MAARSTFGFWDVLLANTQGALSHLLPPTDTDRIIRSVTMSIDPPFAVGSTPGDLVRCPVAICVGDATAVASFTIPGTVWSQETVVQTLWAATVYEGHAFHALFSGDPVGALIIPAGQWCSVVVGPAFQNLINSPTGVIAHVHVDGTTAHQGPAALFPDPRRLQGR